MTLNFAFLALQIMHAGIYYYYYISLPKIKQKTTFTKNYLPFYRFTVIIFEISGPLSSSLPKIPFHRTPGKIFDDI